jgi:hypothetical protein
MDRRTARSELKAIFYQIKFLYLRSGKKPESLTVSSEMGPDLWSVACGMSEKKTVPDIACQIT